VRRSMGLLSIAVLLSASTVVGLSQTAVASTGTHLVFAGPIVGGALAVPNSNIKIVRGVARYKPKTLDVTWSGPSGGTCTKAKIDFTISNTTAVTEIVTLGTKHQKIPAGRVAGVCLFGSGNATYVFGLKGSPKKLTVTVT